jgi:chaperonin GroEL
MKVIYSNPKEIILSTIDKYLDFITPTYGPVGETILIADRGVRAVDDGKIGSEHFESEDDAEQAIIDYIKDTTAKTNDRIQDGTTTAAILMSALVKELYNTKGSKRDKVLQVRKGLEDFKRQILKKSKQIKGKADLEKVAFSAYNNKEVSKIVAEVVDKVGTTGIIHIENADDMHTSYEIASGYEVRSGYISSHFTNRGDKVFLDKPYVIIVNDTLQSVQQVMPILELVMKSSKREFVIFADSFSDQVLSVIAMNKVNGVFNPLLVNNEGFGDDKYEVMNKIAEVSGAVVFDPKLGSITKEHFGIAKSVEATQNKTSLIGKKSIEGTQSAVIKVGSPTKNEQFTVREKVEDAVGATKIALSSKNGIVLGGGMTYKSIKTSSPILNKALQKPREVLESNGKKYLKEVYDTTESLIASLESAVSIACGLVEIGRISVVKREHTKVQ